MTQISEYFRSIFFPNLGITLRNIGDHINIGSFEVTVPDKKLKRR